MAYDGINSQLLFIFYQEHHNSLSLYIQSGFCPLLSTETVLVKVINDLLMAAASEPSTTLILQSLSVAFESISRNVLLNRLQL